MPCISMWYEYLERGTPRYEEARAAVEAQLRALRHAIDYYYGAAGAAVPRADHERAPLDFVEGEEEILDRIKHHLACDGVHCQVLYDAESLLNRHVPEEAGYSRVLLDCALTARAVMADGSRPPRDTVFTLRAERWYAAELFSEEDRSLCSPASIFVRRAVGLKTGRGELELSFHRKRRRAGGQDERGTFRVLERSQRYLVATRVDGRESTVLVIFELTWAWLGKTCRMYPKNGGGSVQDRLGRP
jgi:hypothetical protein